MNVLLVGEANPYGGDPDMALYPLPEHASGGRLARILGLSRGEYLRTFDRCNLCAVEWRLPEARERARQLVAENRVMVLLGAKVARAFGGEYEPFTRSGVGSAVYVLPHPSGLNRAWNEPGAVERARALVAEALRIAARVHVGAE